MPKEWAAEPLLGLGAVSAPQLEQLSAVQRPELEPRAQQQVLELAVLELERERAPPLPLGQGLVWASESELQLLVLLVPAREQAEPQEQMVPEEEAAAVPEVEWGPAQAQLAV